ncbi:unnamed protein product [Closterium sp. NIES-54]
MTPLSPADQSSPYEVTARAVTVVLCACHSATSSAHTFHPGSFSPPPPLLSSLPVVAPPSLFALCPRSSTRSPCSPVLLLLPCADPSPAAAPTLCVPLSCTFHTSTLPSLCPVKTIRPLMSAAMLLAADTPAPNGTQKNAAASSSPLGFPNPEAPCSAAMGSPLRQGSRSRAWTDRQGDWTAGIDWDTHRWAVDNLIQLGGACRFTSADWNAVVPGHPRWKETQAPCSSSSSSPSSSSRSCSNSSSLAVSFAKILRGSARASFPMSTPAESAAAAAAAAAANPSETGAAAVPSSYVCL